MKNYKDHLVEEGIPVILTIFKKKSRFRIVDLLMFLMIELKSHYHKIMMLLLKFSLRLCLNPKVKQA